MTASERDGVHLPIACVPEALTPEQRQQSRRLREGLAAATVVTHEVVDGYTFELAGGEALRLAAEWIPLERRCCPFLTFAIQWPQGDDHPRLIVTGPVGTKQFLKAEMPELPSETVQLGHSSICMPSSHTRFGGRPK